MTNCFITVITLCYFIALLLGFIASLLLSISIYHLMTQKVAMIWFHNVIHILLKQIHCPFMMHTALYYIYTQAFWRCYAYNFILLPINNKQWDTLIEHSQISQNCYHGIGFAGWDLATYISSLGFPLIGMHAFISVLLLL